MDWKPIKELLKPDLRKIVITVIIAFLPLFLVVILVLYRYGPSFELLNRLLNEIIVLMILWSIMIPTCFLVDCCIESLPYCLETKPIIVWLAIIAYYFVLYAISCLVVWAWDKHRCK